MIEGGREHESTFICDARSIDLHNPGILLRKPWIHSLYHKPRIIIEYAMLAVVGKKYRLRQMLCFMMIHACNAGLWCTNTSGKSIYIYCTSYNVIGFFSIHPLLTTNHSRKDTTPDHFLTLQTKYAFSQPSQQQCMGIVEHLYGPNQL